MNIDPSQIPNPIPPAPLTLKIYNLSEAEIADVSQKGADPDEYICVEWQCPRMTAAGLSEKGEHLMQAWFLIPPRFLKLAAGPTLFDPQGQPITSPEKIQQAFFPYSLPTFRALVRKADLSEEVPIPKPAEPAAGT
jgi:hypothetical protein